MTKPGDLPATKKTIQELSKEFPDKTYRELEIYREKYEKEHNYARKLKPKLSSLRV